MTSQPRQLEEWCIVFTEKSGKVSARAVGKLVGNGRRKRHQKFYRTTALDVQNSSGRTMKTRSGKCYSLVGPMSLGNAVLAGMPRKLLGTFKDGLPTNWFHRVAIDHGSPLRKNLPTTSRSTRAVAKLRLLQPAEDTGVPLLLNSNNENTDQSNPVAAEDETRGDKEAPESIMSSTKQIDVAVRTVTRSQALLDESSASENNRPTPRRQNRPGRQVQPKPLAISKQPVRAKRQRKTVVYTEQPDSPTKKVGFAESSKENIPVIASPETAGIQWTKHQITAYRKARGDVSSAADDYWVQISRRVPGKTPEDCVRYFEVCYETPGRHKAPKTTATPDAANYIANYGKTGRMTAKYKQSIRTIANAVDRGYEDDVFQQGAMCYSPGQSSEPLKIDDESESPELRNLVVGDLATSVKRARRDAAAAMAFKTPDVLSRGRQQSTTNDMDAYNAILKRNAAKAGPGLRTTKITKKSRKSKTPQTPALTRRNYLETPGSTGYGSIHDTEDRDLYFS